MDNEQQELNEAIAVAIQTFNVKIQQQEHLLTSLIYILQSRDPSIKTELVSTLQGPIKFMDQDGADSLAAQGALEIVENLR